MLMRAPSIGTTLIRSSARRLRRCSSLWWRKVGLEHEVTRLTVCEYLKPLLADGIDTLVLDCTHFPLLKPLIGREAGNVALVDSAITTDEKTARVLAQEGLLNTDNNNPDYRFYVSDIPLKFRTIGERFLGRTMEQIEMVSLG